MSFLFKKILINFFFPLTFIFSLMFFGIILLWSSKKQKLGRTLVTVAFIIFVSISYGFISNSALRYFETCFSRLEDINNDILNDVKWIVVLGGGVSSDALIPLTCQLNSSTLTRVIEGIRVYKKVKNAKIVFSGGKVFDDLSEAYLMSKMAIELGVNESDIYLEERSLDTKNQARLIKGIVKEDLFCLVTSAYHMYRSLYLFKQVGLNPIPIPTDYLIKDNKRLHPDTFFPSSRKIWKFEKLIKELLGILFEKVRSFS